MLADLNVKGLTAPAAGPIRRLLSSLKNIHLGDPVPYRAPLSEPPKVMHRHVGSASEATIYAQACGFSNMQKIGVLASTACKFHWKTCFPSRRRACFASATRLCPLKMCFPSRRRACFTCPTTKATPAAFARRPYVVHRRVGSAS